MTHAKLIPAIGLSGLAGSGKTTVAKHLEARWGMTRLHIAEPLRAMLRPLYEAFGVDDPDAYLTGDLKEQVVPGIGVTSRQLQITIGTEWGRRQVHDDLWVDAWEIAAARCHETPINDSVRFPNEEDTIAAMGGFAILIERPGCEPAAYRWGRGGWIGRLLYETMGCMWGVHPSERIDMLEPTYVVINDGPVEALLHKIDTIVAGEIGLRLRRPAARSIYKSTERR